MAIEMYTGTPGSGKSYHATRRILAWLNSGGNLIANFPVNVDCIKKKKRKDKLEPEYWDNSEMTAGNLVAYALKHHKIGKEGQTLVVIDECQVLFNCRDFGRKDRNAWVQFFSQHRKLGYDFLLITQSDRMLDKQIRALVETEVKHRKLNNYGFGGVVLSLFTLKSTWFVAIEYWYGGNKLRLSQQMFRYQKKYEKVYDSYRLFTDMLPGNAPADCAGVPGRAGPRGTAAGAPGGAEAEKMEKEVAASLIY